MDLVGAKWEEEEDSNSGTRIVLMEEFVILIIYWNVLFTWNVEVVDEECPVCFVLIGAEPGGIYCSNWHPGAILFAIVCRLFVTAAIRFDSNRERLLGVRLLHFKLPVYLHMNSGWEGSMMINN